MKRLGFLSSCCFLLTQCIGPAPMPQAMPQPSYAPAPSGGMPQIINVSAYDPKEKQRGGVGYSENDVVSPAGQRCQRIDRPSWQGR